MLASAPPARAELIGLDQRISPIPDEQNDPDIAAFGDHLVAVWYWPSPYPDVGWAHSADGGTTWTDGGGLPRTSTAVPAGFPTVCADRAGNFYAAGRLSTNLGDALGVWRGGFQGSVFAWQPAVAPIAPDFYVPPYVTPRIVCDPERGYVYLTYTLELGRLFMVRSLDGNQTWSAPVALNDTPTSSFARPAVGPDGELYVLWEDFASQQVIGRKSTDFGASFGTPFVVAPILDDLNMSPPSWLGGLGNPVYPTIASAPDGPSVAVDRSTGPNRGRVYATWTDYATGTLGPDLGYASDYEPNNFFANASPLQIGQSIYHFIPNGHTGQTDCDLFTFVGEGGATLWLSGEITSVSRPISSLQLPVPIYCGEDTTHLVQVASVMTQLASQGPLPPAIYTFPATGRYWLSLICAGISAMIMEVHTRTLIPDPGQAARDQRDVVLVSSSDGGATWSPKVRVNDDPPRFDNTFPEVAVDALGQVHVAWYDRRDDDTPCGTHVNTYWTVSRNGGASFRPSQRLSRRTSAWECWPQASYRWSNVGDHLALKAEGTRVYALWAQEECPDSVNVFAVRINADDPTAIAVSQFDAVWAGAAVEVTWQVSDARGLVGFRVERAEGESGAFAPLGAALRPAAGEGEYRQEDATAEPGKSYLYRLQVVRGDGSSDRIGPVSVEVPPAITRLAWQRVNPNPFSDRVALVLAIPKAGEADVQVFDISGHEVASLHRGPVGPGVLPLIWDGRGASSAPAPPGVYVVRARLAKEVVSHRVIRLR